MKHFLHQLRHDLGERRHRRATRDVLATPAIAPRDDGVVLFSMIGTRVLRSYLVAVKSLHHQLKRGRIVILDDGTLTGSDRAILDRHLGTPRVLSIRDVDTGPCPRGGTWERLLTILDLRAEDYVIQLDSDTVTTGAVPEVAAAIGDNRSFTIRGGPDAELLDVDRIAAPSADASEDGAQDRHIQSAIEARMNRLEIPGRNRLRYVRGCSGFTGFSKGGEGRALAEAFSSAATRLVGADRWAEWGTEQVTSNFVIANEDGPALLPYERYLNHWNQPIPDDARFVHFIGTCRYHRGTYGRVTRQAIARLVAGS